jgi:hypothetical protein
LLLNPTLQQTDLPVSHGVRGPYVDAYVCEPLRPVCAQCSPMYRPHPCGDGLVASPMLRGRLVGVPLAVCRLRQRPTTALLVDPITLLLTY